VLGCGSKKLENNLTFMQKTSFSKLIAGTMTWGVWGKNFTKKQMIDLMNSCLENNITTFDHADIYGAYTTENNFGEAFSASKIDREKVQFISKCGIQYVSENRKNTLKHYDYSAKHITQSVENSLKNLQTDYLDLLLLHRPSPLMQADEIANTIEKLKSEGKILDFGVSNFTPSQTALIESKIKINYNQIQFSATHFEAMIDGSLDFMQTNNIIPMAWNPLGSFFKDNENQSVGLIEIVKLLSEKYKVEADVLLFAWILKHPAGILPVFGTTDKSRISNLSKATNFELELEDWFAIWTAQMGNKVP
jgi:predicted oxidoreductase